MRSLFSSAFHGNFSDNRDSDPGMEGSLLYHMAMVTKMEAEPRLVLEELKIKQPNIQKLLDNFFKEFILDVEELTKSILPSNIDPYYVIQDGILKPSEKISLFRRLTEDTKKVELLIDQKTDNIQVKIRELFQDWTRQIIKMRLRQECETLKGFLIITKLVETVGVEKVAKAMSTVQDKFGQETVQSALNVTLRSGKNRKNLDKAMLSDHFVHRKMDMEKLEGSLKFLNCPIYGCHKYVSKELKIEHEVRLLFCKYFCYAHAKAMFETVLPFPFNLSQPKYMEKDKECEFLIKLSKSDNRLASEKFVPLVLSWNVTSKCNLKCTHCYINAKNRKMPHELSTNEGKTLIDQIVEVSKPLLILSGGEPLLRGDLFELIQHGVKKGLKIVVGSNGMLLDDETANRLREVGVNAVSISLDSSNPEKHDNFRGVKGSWAQAIKAIRILKNNDILAQVNTTVTKQNYNEIQDIMGLTEDLGVENLHLFFLVPTGRGVKMDDISPLMYEKMIEKTLIESSKHKLNIKPSCAPQFIRIAKTKGIDINHIQGAMRGCIAGLYYCRIYPNGEVTPCPYLPIKLGNIRTRTFKDIWFNSTILKNLRDPNMLQGKCGTCEFNDKCGGCRARAYGLSSHFIDFCGDLHEPSDLKGNYLAEDPWCIYQPQNPNTLNHKSLKQARTKNLIEAHPTKS